MKTSIHTILLLPIFLAVPCTLRAQNSLSSPAPSASFVNEEAAIKIPAGSSEFDITFDEGSPGSSEIYAVLGFFGADQPAFADVGYFPDAEGNPGGPQSPPCIVVGSQNNGYAGIVVWKLVFADPIPPGAKASFDVRFTGRPQSQGETFFVGASESIEVNKRLTGMVVLPTETRSVDQNIEEFGTYDEIIDVPLPEGENEVFLTLADVGTSARIILRQIAVTLP